VQTNLVELKVGVDSLVKKRVGYFQNPFEGNLL
jgi:hypothetical protein